MLRNIFSISAWVTGVLVTAALLLMAAPETVALHGPRLQGQVPLEDQLSGRSLQGYRKHVRVVGQNDILKRGMNGNLGWVDDCAYVSAYYGATHPLAGLAVVDASNPRRPKLVKIWPGTPGTRESQVEGNQDSRMVVVMPFPSATIFGDPPGPASLLQIYDVPADCTNLVRRGTYNFGSEGSRTIVTHEHRIWRDKIYVTVSGATDPGPAISVVDASDRDHPVLLTTWDLSDEPGMAASGAHDLDVSADGTRAYINIRVPRPGGGTDSGLAILDTSAVANWRPGMPRPTIRRISRILSWSPPNAGSSHSAQVVKIEGRTYVLTQNEVTSTTGCPWGWAQIVDVNDELNPTTISSFLLEVNLRSNCDRTLRDDATYSSHYLGVDDPEEAKLAFFTWYSSGLRVVDISNPYSPKEVGYFIPGATPDTLFRATGTALFHNNKIDHAYSFVRFHKGNIWFTSAYGGFWVVRFTGKHEDADDD